MVIIKSLSIVTLLRLLVVNLHRPQLTAVDTPMLSPTSKPTVVEAAVNPTKVIAQNKRKLNVLTKSMNDHEINRLRKPEVDLEG